MKTGSFILPKILSEEVALKVSGGEYNFNYKPEPPNYFNMNVTAMGKPNSPNNFDYTYTATFGMDVNPFISMSGSISGNSNQPLNAVNCSFVARW